MIPFPTYKAGFEKTLTKNPTCHQSFQNVWTPQSLRLFPPITFSPPPPRQASKRGWLHAKSTTPSLAPGCSWYSSPQSQRQRYERLDQIVRLVQYLANPDVR